MMRGPDADRRRPGARRPWMAARAALLAVCAAGACAFAPAGAAGAVESSPAWSVTDLAVPTVLVPAVGREGKYDAVVENVGQAASAGQVTVSVPVPGGLSVFETRIEPGGTCKTLSGEVQCVTSDSIASTGFIVVQVRFRVAGEVSDVESVASVSGGGAAEASDAATMRLASATERKAAGGFAQFRFGATGPAGEPVTQAGGHPALVTTSLLLNNFNAEIPSEPGKVVNEAARPAQAARDLAFYLPLGMLGDPAVTTPCTVALLEIAYNTSGCPQASRVGTILPMILGNVFANPHGIYSVTPELGYAAEFAFATNNLTFVLYASVVRHDGAYMLRVVSPGLTRDALLVGVVASFFGDIEEVVPNKEPVLFDRGAFLTDPMDCSAGELRAQVAMDLWDDPNPRLPIETSAPAFASVNECGLLRFSSDLSVKPQTTQADAPSGYQVGLENPQGPNGAGGLGTPPMRDVSVTLPAGTTISPSSANGLEACPETGPQGFNLEGVESEEVGTEGGEDAVEHPAPAHCPTASQIGTATAKTPLLPDETLTGKLFLAPPRCGGAGPGEECTDEDASEGRLFRLYLELDGPDAGIVVKLEGKARVNPETGQIDTVFEDNPQFPVSDLTVTTNGGARAPLANGQTCGVAVSSATITPWSAPETPAVETSDFFRVDWDGDGGACPGSLPFSPALVASGTGTTSSLAARTSPFTFTLKREDREQNIAALSTTLPEGLLANVTKVARCPEPEASQATLTACPASSQIGTTTVAVGPGSDPYYVTGRVFFTGPYTGREGTSPFGLSVVVPAVAGPFNLGDVLVRVGLFVNPKTSQVKAVSEPLPASLDGVPLELRVLNLNIENHNFVLNPTSCTPTDITGEVISRGGATADVASPFAAAGCGSLSFSPVLSASTEARSTKIDGTGVDVKIAYPSTGQANIAKVDVTFPRKLPVRLATLREACPAATFDADPASCPAASAVGSAVVHTPILSQPLTGPAYLVSYGSAQFPNVVFVLQGEGVELVVSGESSVSSSGVLKVTFDSVPDAPFSTFETRLPSGPYSQFTSTKTTTLAKASQCGEDLVVPVTMIAHNGAQLTKNVTMSIAGCPPSISVVKAHAGASGVAVTVQSDASGRLAIAGRGLRKLSESRVSAGRHTFTLPYTSQGRREKRAHRKIRITVQLVVGNHKVSKHKTVAL